MSMALDEIQCVTRQMGEDWAYPHVKRVMALAQRIAGDLEYEPLWFEYAAWMHDWGAFPCYRQKGVDHALRSRQVAETLLLPGPDLPAPAIEAILEAIELHDYRDQRPTVRPEALLLREADFLDFLGPLGVAREFAWGPNNLKKVIERVRSRMVGIRGRFSLPAAQVLAETRLAEMEALLLRLEQESFGYL